MYHNNMQRGGSFEFPQHITSLMAELNSCEDPISTLKSSSHLLQSDMALYNIYLSLSYNPVTGDFSSPPSLEEVLSKLRSEYSEPEFRAFHDMKLTGYSKLLSDGNRNMKEEFLKTFLDSQLDLYSHPAAVGLEDIFSIPKHDKPYMLDENSQTSIWSKQTGDFSTPNSLRSHTTHSPLPSVASIPTMHKFTTRSSKGLKVLSVYVKEVVSKRVFTSYKEVADEMIKDMELTGPENVKEEKNVRRRVYDALNVLIAAGAVEKNGRAITWNRYFDQKTVSRKPGKVVKSNEIQRNIQEKKEKLREILKKSDAFRNLLSRNAKERQHSKAIPMPFVIVASEGENQNSEKGMEVTMEFDAGTCKSELKFKNEFKIYGDLEILVKLGMHKNGRGNLIPEEVLRLLECKYIPLV